MAFKYCAFIARGMINDFQETLTDIFESPVEDLQLFFAEFGLLYKTVKALRSVTHCR